MGMEEKLMNIELILIVIAIAAGVLFRYKIYRWIFHPTLEGIDDMETHRGGECARCKCRITEDNDSLWRDFVGPSAVQPVCKTCAGTCDYCHSPLVTHWHVRFDFGWLVRFVWPFVTVGIDKCQCKEGEGRLRVREKVEES